MAKDLLLDDSDDLLIEAGDLVVDDSQEQEVGLLLRTAQGEWRASPLTGFGVQQRTRSEINRTQFERELSTQLELDGFDVKQASLSVDGQLSISVTRHE